MPILHGIAYRFENRIRDFLKITATFLSGKIGTVFIVIGVISLVFSIYSSSQILAFIGLGLTFWGALFLLSTPKSYIEERFLISTALPEYSNIDKIIKELRYVKKSYYIPAYPENDQVPEHLSGLTESVVFISASNVFVMPSLEDISKGKFLAAHKKGILLTPPGMGLLTQIKKEIKFPITKTDIAELCETLPRVILQNFTIAQDLTMKTEKENIHLVIKGSIFKNLYSNENNLDSILFLGCPLTSAIASLLALFTGKTITIKQTNITQGGSTIETTFQFAG